MNALQINVYEPTRADDPSKLSQAPDLDRELTGLRFGWDTAFFD